MKDRITISVSSISVFNNFPEENEEGWKHYGGDGDNVVEMGVWRLVAKREGECGGYGMWMGTKFITMSISGFYI